MEGFELLILILNIFATFRAEILSDFFDYRQINQKCVAIYLKELYNFNITVDEQLAKKCVTENQKFETSIFDTIDEILKGQEINNSKASECAINLFGFYNINSVIFKALAYNHAIVNLTLTPNPQKSCENVIKPPPPDIIIVIDDCDEKVMTVRLAEHYNHKSFTHFRHCLNDLFRAYRVDKIVFDDGFGEIFMRKFGRHLMEFLRQLMVMALKYCENDVGDTVEGNSFEDLAAIDLFGFTEPSLRVEWCIIDELRGVAGKVLQENSKVDQKIVIEAFFKCLKEF